MGLGAMKRLVLAVMLVAGCSTTAPSPTLPTIQANGCEGVGLLNATLAGDANDPHLAWLVQNGTRMDVVFPAGFTARFNPRLEIVDGSGAAVAHEGDVIDGACVTGPDVQDRLLILWEPQPGSTPEGVASPAPSGSPSTDTSCRTDDLAITITNTGGGAGIVGGYLRVQNVSTGACTLSGPPSLVGVAASGAATPARAAPVVGMPFPKLSGSPTVELAPGEAAFAAYGGSDRARDGTVCPPPFHTFRVAPPGDAAIVELPTYNGWLGADQPSCAGLQVTAIVSQADLESFVELDTPVPLSPLLSDIAASKAAVTAYTQLLVEGKWSGAYGALAPQSRSGWASEAAFASDQAAFFKSVAGQFTVNVPSPSDQGPITDWAPEMRGASLDLGHAVLVEVDYPALRGNNAGYNLYIVQPGPAGLEIYLVR